MSCQNDSFVTKTEADSVWEVADTTNAFLQFFHRKEIKRQCHVNTYPYTFCLLILMQASYVTITSIALISLMNRTSMANCYSVGLGSQDYNHH